MGKGIFPPLSSNDIISSLSAWGYDINKEQLRHPTPDFVQGVFCACLKQVTDIDAEALQDPVTRALNHTQLVDKDLYATSLSNHLLLRHLTRFADAARVDHFCSRDIYMPERERTLFVLSGFINFIKFTQQYCEDVVRKLRDNSEGIIVEREKVSKKLSQITEEIEHIKAKFALDEPKCVQLREENAAIRAQLFASKEMQVQALEEIKNLKIEKADIVKEKELINAEIVSISALNTRAQSRIVKSPDRIKQKISTMGFTLQQDKQTVAMQESKARDLQAKITALTNIEKDVRGCIEQLQTIEKEVRSLQESQKELHQLKDLVEGQQIRHKELHLHRERLFKQLSNAQEKLERAQRHAEDRKVASQKTIERLQAEYDDMVVERRDTDKQVEDIRAQANEIEGKINEHLKTSETELNQLLAEYWKLRHNTDVYMHTLANKLDMKVDFI
ncbi:hypothetical protein MIND_01057900 [Mycena indigotica]|uniref:Kinetochore protein NUF2 n=1 Tax=Mycena indigotica TaxID=2126181 RepID=A0A8H6S918_9AGAR|nr:uncharacterized protein MIND_01057900 [Mycena indigotica]KAF7295191.1 hypothetical protein MIND_01057900 [Mycena indigotica]